MKKSCFIITPIGTAGSSIRKRVDQWNDLIYSPALDTDFKIIRADKISSPGIITEQILDHIIKSELVIIDYTDLNPNVMYEAAIRHIAKKPFIQICPITQTLPFDINNLRAVRYDPEDLKYPQKLVDDIKECYKLIQDPNYKIPEILPMRFDLEQIVKDPEKFVELLKKYLPITSPQGIKNNIIEVYEPNLYFEYPKNTVKCPNCGTIQSLPYSSTVALNPLNNKHYKCNVCGTEFE